ncbi:I78 family peptidase inhibitor [Pseudoxanthomonas indica]|uniref:Peptidase inhibitor I78 family protein n=1 Tax=Pseudoxanthomonas indica TaxID=428993 RepID=A0A1T5KKV6_9GAMM|nr:I78 family peptidase inhibitor [Pseudoxanthomonas indica]GGD49972.1 hypothetical protein GCM10007235_22470 [Pseudoxanthomonas indica]SKC64376.1 Peptidase inhibitor I78 family protein [Pseudoxanthomonas indica]
MRELSGKTLVQALWFGSLLGLAACASQDTRKTAQCDDSQLGWAIGQPGDEANLARLWKESGAGLMNPIAPTTVVKRDSRPDRLRVYLDKDNRVTAVRCE